MRDSFPFLVVFTVPVDAGPNDDRVVIGPGDQIAIFEGASLVVFMDINGIIVGPNLDQVSPFGTSDQYVALQTGGAEINLRFPTNVDVASVRATRLAAIDRLRLEMGSSLVDIRGDGIVDVQADDLQLSGASVPRGLVVPPFVETTNDGPHTTDTVSDMALADVPVVDGRTYRIQVVTVVSLSAAAGRWDGRIRVDGTNIALAFSTLNISATTDPALNPVTTDAYYTATATGTIDVDLFLDEVVAGSDLTLAANATVPRWLTIEDLGAP